MAAGASSPELFSSIVALFITHSALGLGTIVGSEIFNQLIICAGAVFASRSGKLQLDRAILAREVGFYALSIVLLWLALQDSRPLPEDNNRHHLFISFGDSVMVFVGYVAYVAVCANMEAVVNFCVKYVCCLCSRRQQEPKGQYARLKIGGGTDDGGGGGGTGGGSGPQDYGTSFRRANLPVDKGLPFLHETPLMAKEPSDNFVRFYQTRTGEKAARKALRGSEISNNKNGGGAGADDSNRNEGDGDSESKGSFQPSVFEQSMKKFVATIGNFSEGGALRGFDFLLETEKPSDEHGLYDIEVNSVRIAIGECEF